MLRLRLQKLGSILGLLAILMSTLAPTISQALASQHRLDNALTTYCSADAAAPAGDRSHPANAHWEACAYCGLLLHTPVLPGAPATFIAAATVAHAPDTAVRIEVRATEIHTAAFPRAPPRFS